MIMKILILLPSYQLGGTNTSLNYFLKYLSIKHSDKNTIDVYALTPFGPNANYLSQFANLLNNPPKKINKSGVFYIIKNIIKPFRCIAKIIGYDIVDIQLKRIATSLEQKYDCVIAYQEGQCTKLLSFLNDKSFKIAWVHCEYSSLIKFSKGNIDHSPYEKVDKIVCVSQAASADFVNCFPKYKDKVITIYNQLDPDRILRKSIEFNPYLDNESQIKIVSVGRIDSIKRFSYIPKVLSALSLKESIIWFIVGGIAHQSEYKALLRNIKKYGVENRIKIIGPVENPYPYIKYADLLVCLSSSESFSYVISEAKILGTPIVTTDFACAKEFLRDGLEGSISSVEEIPATINEIFSTEKLKHYRDELKHVVYLNPVTDSLLKEIKL